MNIFVTGATGYIGNAVARAFRRAGHQVRGLVRGPQRARALAAAEILPVYGDLTAPELFHADAAAADVLVHCAFEDSSEAVLRDATAVETLLSAARAAGAPRAVLYTSDVWVYGSTGAKVADERSSLAPLPRVAWRLAHEERILSASAGAVRTVVVRPGLVYGRSGGLFGPLYASALAGEVEIWGGGGNRWSTVHVDDLAAAYVAVAEHAEVSGALNLTDGARETVREIAAALAAAAGADPNPRELSETESEARFGALDAGYRIDQQVSSARARAALGWAPRHLGIARDAGLYLAAWKALQGAAS